MSEKRKPELVLVARIYGKSGVSRSIKVEAFSASLWDGSSVGLDCKHWGKSHGDRYRVRVQGKWYKAKTFTMSELLAMFRKSIIGVRQRLRS